MLQITKGVVNRAQRVTIYGPEGIGKSTLASLFPNPIFIDVEQGTDQLDVARTPKPASFEMVRQIITDFRLDPQGYQTLVVDTADWAERLAIIEVCNQNNLGSLGGAEDYGRSYNLLEEKWAKMLDSMTEICMGLGIHIIILAHAAMRKFEQPEEVGAFDRWEMKLQKKTSAKLKEWSDMLLFAGYKTLVVAAEKTKVKKGVGGARVIRTTHHPCWDAKNRHDLPDEIALAKENTHHLPIELYNIFYPEKGPAAPSVTPPEPSPSKDVPKLAAELGPIQQEVPAPISIPTTPSLPPELVQLMEANDVTEKDIRRAVAKKGYYPLDTPITNYDSEFIGGVLVGAWEKLQTAINNLTEEDPS